MKATLVGVYANDNQIGFHIDWVGEEGFGEIMISKNIAGQYTFIDSENMGKEFIKKILCSIVDEAVIGIF